ncbi:zinc finger protein 836-like [Bufo gargarizans]|uniref:zinc finger protein 836-like n=1 Tax=Bufo gargarizans TaxID=30331 RepID=UPI001CF22270|nr:zinc finger protein 836-like [Bufo gargarizans]
MHRSFARSLQEVPATETIRTAAMEQAPVTFEDVAVYFSRREWETLSGEQKSLYKEVMNENYQMILSLNRPDIIQSIDLGCEPYVQSLGDCDHTGVWQEKNMKAESSFQPSRSDITSSRCEAQVKRQRRYPRVNPFRWIKKDKKKKSRISRSAHRTSKRTKEKKTLGGDDLMKVSPERRRCDVSTSISHEPASNPEDKPLLDEPCGMIGGSKDLCSEEEAADETEADPSGEAISTRKIQEDVSEGSSLTRGARFATNVKNYEKRSEDAHLPSNVNCFQKGEDSRLHGDSADSKDIPVCETSNFLMEATNESPSKNASPETATGKEEKMSPTTEKKASHKKRDKHVKFNEVVTMILIKQQSEERSSKCLESGVKLQSTSLPVLKNVNDDDKKKKVEKCSTGHDVEDRTSQGQNSLHRNVEGNKHTRKRPTGSSCRPSTMKYSKKRIVVGTGPAPQALEQQMSPSKNNVRERNELHGVEDKEVWNMNSEGRKVNTCSVPPQTNSPLNNHEQKFIKSYSCSNCGKITHWSKLSIYQKENIERSIAHMCRTCGRRHKSSSPATAPDQAILPLALTSPGVDEMSKPANYSKKIAADSSAQPNTEKRRHKDERKVKTTEDSRHLVTASDQRTGASSDHCRKPPQTPEDDSKSNACHQYRNPEAALDVTLKTFTGSSVKSTSTANHSTLGLDSRKNRIIIKDKNVASKSPAEQPRKPGDNREHEVCTIWKECSITEERNHPLRSDQQKKVTKSCPSVLQKTQNFPQAAVKTHSINLNNVRNPRRIVDPIKSKFDKDCTKCGKSLAKHVTVNSENPADGSEKNCVLRVKTKCEQPPEDREPFQCKQCGKIFTKKHTKPPGEHPYSCKKCGKSFHDSGNNDVHMKLKTKEKMKIFTGSSADNAFADTSTPGLDSSYSRTGTKDKKMTFKSFAELPGKTDSKEHEEVCIICGESFIAEQKNDPLVSDQQKKRTKGRPSVLENTQDHLKTCSSCVSKIRNPRQIENPENLQSNQNCSKWGKSSAEHVKAENPAEGGKKNHVLQLKKRKQPLEGIEPYQCKQCGKTFTRHFTLLQHHTVHTGERPYSCKECGKSFRDGGYLKVHMRLHTKEKPYTCSECGKCFGQNSTLMVHLRTHTDERPFQCSECGKSFSDRSTFRHHQ